MRPRLLFDFEECAGALSWEASVFWWWVGKEPGATNCQVDLGQTDVRGLVPQWSCSPWGVLTLGNGRFCIAQLKFEYAPMAFCLAAAGLNFRV